MQTHQKLLYALLSVTIFPLLIYFTVNMASERKMLDNFQEVGGELLPGNIAMARMMTELYHITYMSDKYASSRDENDKRKVEQLVANLDVYLAMHTVYHNQIHDELVKKQIADFFHRFSSFITKYLAMLNAGSSDEELLEVKLSVEQAQNDFVSAMNPLIDKELIESTRKLKESRQRNVNVVTLQVWLGILITCLVLSISFFISRRFREVLKESDEYKNNLERLVSKRTCELEEKYKELENEIQERRKAENTLQSVLDSANPICITSTDHKILKVNKSYLDIWPASDVHITTMKCYESRPGSLCHTESCPLTQVVGGNKEVVCEAKKFNDDNKRDFIVTARPFLDERGELLGIVESFQEITDIKKTQLANIRLERDLRQAQKMESIGTLAGGIAHDFNNILAPIYAYVELSLAKLPDDSSQVRGYLGEVLQAAQRAKELVAQILSLSRQKAQNKSLIGVHIIVKEVLKLLQASIPTSIEIRHKIDSNCGTVMADPTQIHQVLMNLCTNAYYAMRETGGILGITLSPYKITEYDILKKINLQPGPYIRIEVSDTGPGIDKKTLDRIFEPYFTTKPLGEGTGMGLSVAHGIIKNYGGHISVYSEPNEGTTFNIYLPIVKDLDAEAGIIEAEAQQIPAGKANILLVDDEESTLGAAEAALGSLGYTVQAHSNPLKALEHFREHPGMFDLVITDMTMPKMSGDTLAREIMAIEPEMPVVMCTGFSEVINEEKAKEVGIRAFLMKPVTINNYATVLHNVLNGKTQ